MIKTGDIEYWINLALKILIDCEVRSK